MLEHGAHGVPGKAGAPGAADPATCCREASGVSSDTSLDEHVLCPLPAKCAPCNAKDYKCTAPEVPACCACQQPGSQTHGVQIALCMML